MVHTGVERSVDLLRGEREQRVTSILSDKIARAFLLDGVAHELALDFNARLVTGLRVGRVWPVRVPHPCGEDDGA